MIKNYQTLQSEYFPNNYTSCVGDPSIYENIIWLDGTVLKADLDAFWLVYLKHSRCVEIDAKTVELIFEGASFDGSIFSMSINAQINWSNFPNLPDALFPLPVMTKDDQVYTLALANKTNFYLTILNFKNTIIQSGSILKAQINSAIDEDSINLIIDNR